MLDATRLVPPVLVLLLLACGGGAPPPPSAAVEQPRAAAAPSADAGGAPSDEPRFATVDLGEPPAATGSSAIAAAPPPPPAEKDDCTPVGIDFEKRVRPKLRECYREAKKKTPALEGMVRIAVSVDTLGKIKSIKIAEKTLPDPVASCMLAVVTKTPFTEASKCPGKEIAIPITFPTRR